MKNLSPIKKIIIGLAAIAVVVSLITANNMASLMLVVASRETGTTQTVQSSGTVSNGDSAGNVSSNNDFSVSDTSSSDNTVSDNAASGDTSSDSSSAGNSDTSKDTAGNSDASKDSTSASDKSDAPASKGEKTTAEIVDLYKKAVNNAKAKAKTVTRVKDGVINYNGVCEAGSLSSVASTLMGMFMVGSEAEIEEKNEAKTNADIPPSGVNSNLTAAGVSSAKCEESGDYYIVTIVAKNATNPTAGADGVGSVSSVIEESQITGAVGSFPGLEFSNFSLAYENVTAVAKIEKSTGNLVNLKTDAPCYLALSAKMGILSIDNAKVGIEVVSEFAMTY